MKKLLLLLLAPALLFQAADAQNSFYKHALIASLGFGGDVYAIRETYTTQGSSASLTQNGSVGCSSYPILVEYGLGKWFGLGLIGKSDNYFLNKDSATGYQPKATGFEFGVVANFHFVRTQHVDFFAGLNLGGSSFTYTFDQYNDQVYGTGSWGDIHAALRYYFGKFGLHATLEFPTMNYNLTSNNKSLGLGQNILATWEARGVAFHLGIHYRFIKQSN